MKKLNKKQISSRTMPAAFLKPELLSSGQRKKDLAIFLIRNLPLPVAGNWFSLPSVTVSEGQLALDEKSADKALGQIFSDVRTQISDNPRLQNRLESLVIEFLKLHDVDPGLDYPTPDLEEEDASGSATASATVAVLPVSSDATAVSVGGGGLTDLLLPRPLTEVSGRTLPQTVLLRAIGAVKTLNILTQLPITVGVSVFGNVYNLLRYGVPRDESLKEAARNIVRASLPETPGEDSQTGELREVSEKAYDLVITLLTVVSAYMATAVTLEADCQAEVLEKYPKVEFETDEAKYKAIEQVLCTPAGIANCPAAGLDPTDCTRIIQAHSGGAHAQCSIAPFTQAIKDAYNGIVTTQQHSAWKNFAQNTQSFVNVVGVFLGLKNAADLCVDPLLFDNVIKPMFNTLLGAAIAGPVIYYATQYAKDPVSRGIESTLKATNPVAVALLDYLEGPAEAPGYGARALDALKTAYEFVIPKSPDSAVSLTLDATLTSVLGREKEETIPPFHKPFATQIFDHFKTAVVYMPALDSETDADSLSEEAAQDPGNVSIRIEADFETSEDFTAEFRKAVISALTEEKDGKRSIASYLSQSPEVIAEKMLEVLTKKGVLELTVSNLQEAFEVACGMDSGTLASLNFLLSNVGMQGKHTDSKVVQFTSMLLHYVGDKAVPVSIYRFNGFEDQFDSIIDSFQFLSSETVNDILDQFVEIMVNGDPYVSPILAEKLVNYYLTQIVDLQKFTDFKEGFKQMFTHTPADLDSVDTDLEHTELGKNLTVLKSIHKALHDALERVPGKSYKGERLQQQFSKIDASIDGYSLGLELLDAVRILSSVTSFFLVNYVVKLFGMAGVPQASLILLLYTLYNIVPKDRAK